MSNIAGQASDAMDSISENLKSVLESAKNQAEVTASVDDNVNNINMMLKQTGDEADGLSDAADDMLGTGREVDNSLKNLYNSNEEVLDAIERIRKQTSETDISVDKIKEAVNLIAVHCRGDKSFEFKCVHRSGESRGEWKRFCCCSC